MEEENSRQPFMTRDLYLASTLVTLHFPLLGTDFQIEGTKPKPIGYFKFSNTEELREVCSQYNQGLLLIEPRMFINNLQSLKSTVVNMFNNPMSEANRHAFNK